MSKSILVSFCNIRVPTAGGLLYLRLSDSIDGRIPFVPITLGYPGEISTVTGLCKWNGYVFAVFSSKQTYYLAVLRENDLYPLFFHPTPEIKDGHSIIVNDEGVYIVSTGNDSIVRYDLDIVGNRVYNPQVVWRASENNKDTHHVNSIVERDGDLFVSAFGEKAGNLWSTAREGYIQNVTKNIRVKSGIYHPHSLSVNNGQIYYCESHFGSFCSLADTIFFLDGYTRGVCWLEKEVVCTATSIGRKISKSTGIIGNPADSGNVVGNCGISVRNVYEDEIMISKDLSWYSSEIYDALVVESDNMDMLSMMERYQISEREVMNGLSIDLKEKEQSLLEIVNSKSWRFILLLRKIRLWLLPRNSIGERILRHIYKRIFLLLI